jgi:hypothetical protein
MSQNEHLTDLEHAIGQLREQRRNWVRTLAAGAGHERGKTESAIESFLKCQTAIEALGRAIDDERKMCWMHRNPKRRRPAAANYRRRQDRLAEDGGACRSSSGITRRVLTAGQPSNKVYYFTPGSEDIDLK